LRDHRWRDRDSGSRESGCCSAAKR